MQTNEIYIEFLIEDTSGKLLLEQILDKYSKECRNLQYRINSFKGIGTLPKKIFSKNSVKTQRLLNDLPMYLRGFNKSLEHLPYRKAIIVVVDNDDQDPATFNKELSDMISKLEMVVDSFICIAVEEMEAWLLGDTNAVITAYPHAKRQLLQNYEPDSIIDTWEYLANIVYEGGVSKLKKVSGSYHEIGAQKCEWATKIGSSLNLRNNKSPSFQYLISRLDYISGISLN